MSHNNEYLRAQLRNLLRDVDYQISFVTTKARNNEVEPATVQSSDGSYVLVPLLLAKSNILLGLSNLD